MRIGILGAGLMGGKLGTIFARAGHRVVFSYAHTQEKLERLARAAGSKARTGTPREAAEHGEVLLLAVHWLRVDDVLRQAGTVKGKVIVTCSLPMNKSDSELAVGLRSSGAEQLARKARGAAVVSAFSTVPSEVLFAVFARRRRKARPSLVYCSDNAHAGRVAARLIRDAGFAPLDAGALRMARYTEPFTMLVAQLAYEGAGGPALGYRFERFREIEKTV